MVKRERASECRLLAQLLPLRPPRRPHLPELLPAQATQVEEDEFEKCPDCDQTFPVGLRGDSLLWHRISKHNYRNDLRQAITTKECVFCLKNFHPWNDFLA